MFRGCPCSEGEASIPSGTASDEELRSERISPEDDAADAVLADDLLSFMCRLGAVRAEYTGEDVSQATLEDILEVGRWSATGGNRQPHEVIVVRDSRP